MLEMRFAIKFAISVRIRGQLKNSGAMHTSEAALVHHLFVRNDFLCRVNCFRAH